MPLKIISITRTTDNRFSSYMTNQRLLLLLLLPTPSSCSPTKPEHEVMDKSTLPTPYLTLSEATTWRSILILSARRRGNKGTWGRARQAEVTLIEAWQCDQFHPSGGLEGAEWRRSSRTPPMRLNNTRCEGRQWVMLLGMLVGSERSEWVRLDILFR